MPAASALCFSLCQNEAMTSLPTAGSTELHTQRRMPDSRVFGLDVVLSASIGVLLQLVGWWLRGKEC